MNEEFGVRNEELESLCHGEEGASQTRQSASPESGEQIAPPPAEPCHDGEEEGRGSGGAAAENNSESRVPDPVLASHLVSLYAQSAELAREIPGFDLKEALRDPDFLRMTSPAVGLSVRRAWYALHGEEREKLAARRAGEAAADALRRGSSRPREGERSLSGGTLSRSDPASLGRVERAALRQRIYDAAARGEKIYP